MQGRSPEYIPEISEESSESVPTDNGFSESKISKIIEGKNTDNKQIVSSNPQDKKRKPAVSRLGRILRPIKSLGQSRKRVIDESKKLSLKEKIINAYKINSNELISLIDQTGNLDGKNIRQEEQLLDEIRQKKSIQEELLHALLLEQRNQLSEEAISKEVWNLIK
ncbi:MAG TPA: hypothetical protein VF189_06485 [Patescibacteria group bacterium]